MENKEAQQKIKKDVLIYWHREDRLMKWSDIKHLELEDDDIIRSYWGEDDYGNSRGQYLGSITRTVEESDQEFEKRMKRLEDDRTALREMRYKQYLKLKEEFENGK